MKFVHKIHYHTDCPFFAGCENMLVNFFNSEELKGCYEISFSYRYSERYVNGLRQRVTGDLSAYPIYFPELSDYAKLPLPLPLIIKRIIAAFFRIILVYPLFAYETFVLYILFKKLNPEIVHINNGGYPAALSARAAAVAGLIAKVPKMIMVVNNMAVEYRGNIFRWMDYPIDCIVRRAVDCFVTGSISASNRLQKVLRLPNSKFVTIHNGIALRPAKEERGKIIERLGLENFDGVVFGVVALLIPRKGHQILLNAILKIKSEIGAENGKFKVLIEGDGPLRAQLEKFVIENGLSQWVTFVGTEKNIVDFMLILDALILPSVQDEDFPNVVLEAMALGKPVIASRLAGTPEQIIDGLTGILVEPRNVDDLAKSMSFIIRNSDVRINMGMAALSCFNDRFTNNKSVNQYVNLYRKLTKELQ